MKFSSLCLYIYMQHDKKYHAGNRRNLQLSEMTGELQTAINGKARRKDKAMLVSATD